MSVEIPTKDYHAIRAAIARGFEPCLPGEKGAFIALGESWLPRHGVDSLGETLEALIDWGIERDGNEAATAAHARRRRTHTSPVRTKGANEHRAEAAGTH